MANAFTRNLSTPIPQTRRANERQVENNAGGYVYGVSDQTRLERFLILGTDKGTYYQGEAEITKQNVDWLVKLIKSDPMLVINTTVEISDGGRAYKNSPAIFALALVFKHGSDEAKAEAKKAVLKVCRTATHIFELAEYFELLGGWSRARRSAIADWYSQKDAEDKLAYQAVKYRQRNGWTHKDLFYLAHPWVDKSVANFIVGKPWDGVKGSEHKTVTAFRAIQGHTTLSNVLTELDDNPNLPWEAIPTQFHKDPEVWKKLFYNGQLKGQALVRNITRLARIGAFDDMVFARDYATKLTDDEMIAKSRLHPLNYLNAIVVHQEGQIQRRTSGLLYAGTRQKNWNTVPVIADALNEGFYKSFKYVEPSGKRTFLALDVSGSMSSTVLGLDLSCAQVSGAMAMTIARTEPYYMVRGFTSSNYGYYSSRSSGLDHDSSGLTDLGISPSMNLNTVMQNVQRSNFGSTDCSLPMEYAIKKKLEIDTFVVFTDNETYQGKRHADVALRDYRKRSGIDARLIVVGMTATNFTIADPQDPGMLDVVGADSNLPRLITDFSAGRL